MGYSHTTRIAFLRVFIGHFPPWCNLYYQIATKIGMESIAHTRNGSIISKQLLTRIDITHTCSLKQKILALNQHILQTKMLLLNSFVI